MQKKKKAIVSVTNDLYTDQRVHKVSLFLVELGYEVTLVGRLRKSSVQLPQRAYKTIRMKLFFDKGALFYAEYNFRLFLLLLFKKTKILVANDLDTLLANYCASRFKKGVEVIYDSHEYFTEVPELVNRPKVQRIWEQIENRIFPKLKKVYTVNQSIAELYSKKYKKDIKVVRNISERWSPDHLKSRNELGIDPNKRMIILQGAGINIDRGAEEAVQAMKFIENTVLYIIGDGDVIPQLKIFVEKNNLASKVIFVGKKPYLEMMNYTYYADIGLSLDKATNMNYRFSLPNKVFDYMHAETPIIATNLIEVSNLINRHNIGIVLEKFDASSLATCISSLLHNPDKLEELKINCKKAKELENWELEKKVLREIYTD